MASRTPSFDELGLWEDPLYHARATSIIHVRDFEDEEELLVEPGSIDPRPPPQDVLDIDRSLAELEAQIHHLRIRKSQILAVHALVARLPPEILSRIFELGVHESIQTLPSVSLVSRHWRDVALATPALWTYIRLDHDWGYGRHSAFIRKIRTCLERSQACKLLIDLDCKYVESAAELRQALALLQPHFERCFSLRLSLPDWEWVELVKSYCAGLGPSLEELHVRLDPADSEDQPPFLFFSQPCPRLSSVTLEHTPLIFIRTSLPVLKSLHLTRDTRLHASTRIGVPFKELLALLSSTPTLTSLRIQSATFLLDGSESIFRSSADPLTLPLLSSLSFHYVDSNNLSLFFESILFPSLTKLSIQMDSSTEDTIHWLARLTAHAGVRRFPELKQLDLRACNVDGAALVPFIRVLHNIPTLTALGLSSPPSGVLGSRIFDILCSAGSTEEGNPSAEESINWVLPRLEALCLQNCRDVSGHELLRVVSARNRAALGFSPGGVVRRGENVSRIRYLKVSQCYGLDPDAHEQLAGAVETLRVSC